MIERILIVGFGSIGRRHVRIIKKLFPDIFITVLRHKDCDPKDSEIIDFHNCTTSIDKAISLKPQAAIIANPATKHLEFAKQLAQKRIHLLIEKPIAASSQGIKEFINLCIEKKIVLMTGYNLRFLPSLIDFRKQIKLNKIGNLYSIRTEVGQYLPNWRTDSDYRKTVSSQKDLGGGVLLELSHEIDYLSWIFGPIKWVKSNVSRQSELEINVEDTANIILGFESSLNGELIATLNMDFIRHDTVRQCVVIGEKGTLRWDGISGEVQYFPENGKEWEVLFSSMPEKDFTYIEEIKHFFFSIERKSSPLVSGEEGLNAVLGVEAIHRSNNSGSIVYL